MESSLKVIPWDFKYKLKFFVYQPDFIKISSKCAYLWTKQDYRGDTNLHGQRGAPNESLWSANPCSKFSNISSFLFHQICNPLYCIQCIKVMVILGLRKINIDKQIKFERMISYSNIIFFSDSLSILVQQSKPRPRIFTI